MALIVEVLDTRGGEVRSRVRVDGVSITVGRGYDNDVILDDLYVDAVHARITGDGNGGYIIEDLGSINGLLIGEEGARETHSAVRSGSTVQIGRTTLRFRNPADPVPPALPDSAAVQRPRGWASNAWIRPAIVFAGTAAAGLSVWLGSYERSSGTDAIGGAVIVAMLGAIWAGGWAIASRAVVRRFNYFSHLTLYSVMVVAAFALGTVNSWIHFLLPGSYIPAGLATVSLIAVAIGLLAAHLGYSTNMPPRRRWWTSGIIVGAIAALFGVTALSMKDEYTDIPSYPGVLKPLPAAVIPTTTIEGFSEEIRELKLPD